MKVILVSLSLVLWALLTSLMLGATTRRLAATSNTQNVPVGQPWHLLYTFSGVSDDGMQGADERKKATSIHCTNVGEPPAQIEIEVWQWNAYTVYTATMSVLPNRTATFSTQNTSLYLDDVFIGGGQGTGAINQGFGRILSSHNEVICTAQLLDPRGYPPQFVTRLPLFLRDGLPVGAERRLYLPVIFKE